jgi:hypothetical protein
MKFNILIKDSMTILLKLLIIKLMLKLKKYLKRLGIRMESFQCKITMEVIHNRMNSNNNKKKLNNKMMHLLKCELSKSAE